MFNLFKKRTEKPVLPAGKMMSRDDIIAFLKTSPEKFLEFEEFYKNRDTAKQCAVRCRRISFKCKAGSSS